MDYLPKLLHDGDNVMVQYENDNIVYKGAQISGEIIQLRRQELEKEKTNNKKIIEEKLMQDMFIHEIPRSIALNCGHLLCSSCVDMIDSREKNALSVELDLQKLLIFISNSRFFIIIN